MHAYHYVEKWRNIILKGIILAGGKGTRLEPMTSTINKHLLPVGKEPMIWHSIKQLTLSGIFDILVISSRHDLGSIINSLGDGKNHNSKLTYRVQDNFGGIATALALGREFIGGSDAVVMLGDNIFEYSIAPYVQEFQQQKNGARICITKVSDPERYGVATINEGKVKDIVEKPNNPTSNYAVTGCYMYPPDVFGIIDTIKPSARHETEISDVNSSYLEQNKLEYSTVKGRWTDAGTFDSLLDANEILNSNQNRIIQ